MAGIDIDDIGHRAEQLFDPVCRGAAGLRIGAIDFGEQRRHHRRTRRGLNDFQRGARRQRDRLQLLAQVERNEVAGTIAVFLGQQGHHDIAHFGPVAQEIMADEPVEVERRRGAGIGLHRSRFGQRADNGGDGIKGACRGFKAGAFGQIGDDLDFGFVVEGQKLDRHRLEVKGRAGDECRDTDEDEKIARRGAVGDDPARDGGIKRTQLAAAFIMAVRRLRQGLPRKTHHQPGRKDHCDKEREHHRSGGIDRDRRHVRPHQARDEQHRQQRRNDRQGGDNRRVADFGDGFDGGLDAGSVIGHCPVAGDILDDDDGVIDQDADREDQREQADPVDRVAHQVRGKHRQQDRRRDNDGSDGGLAPTDGEADEDDDRDGGEAEVVEKLIGLLVRRGAIVAGDGNINAGGDEAAFERVDAGEQRARHHDRIGA